MREENLAQNLECLVEGEAQDGLRHERRGVKWDGDWELGRGRGHRRRRPCAYASNPGHAVRATHIQLKSGAVGTGHSYTHRLVVHGRVCFGKQRLELIFVFIVQGL